MKVCTDACIQGAFTAQYLADNEITAPAILDLGAGTGLLSLMLAQQVDGAITAVELDAAAALQAMQNFDDSPWAHRLTLTRQDIRKMDGTVKYDFIISNPPFYERALRSGHAGKDQAMHATNLSYQELITAAEQQVAVSGKLAVLPPYPAFEGFRELALAAGLHLKQVLYIRQSVNHGFFRTVGIFSRKPGNTVVSELSVYDAERVYTPGFVELLEPYYLYL